MIDIAMLVASVGMQFFTHRASADLNNELHDKQRAFQKAAAERDFERMRRLQAESARLAMELEAEVHQERMTEINNSYDILLESFSQKFAIENWPLNVLPFVMKGETFGSLFIGTAKSVNIHCIFTPSNCDWFNEYFYDILDLRLEMKMNRHWNAQTTHPIIYYGGAWNRRRGQKIDDINLNDIDLLRTQLMNVPVIVITPYLDPYLHFKVNMWGLGQEQVDAFRINIPYGKIELKDRVFSYDYNINVKHELSDDFYNTTVDEFVAYLECLIGFVADKYFWSMYGLPVMLPSIVGEYSFSKNFFILNLYESYKKILFENLLYANKYINALDFIPSLVDHTNIEDKEHLYSLLHGRYLELKGGKANLNTQDIVFLKKILFVSKNKSLTDILSKEIDSILEKERILVWFCANKNEFYQRILNEKKDNMYEDCTFVYQIRGDYCAIGSYIDNHNNIMYSMEDVGYYVVLFNYGQEHGVYAFDAKTLSVSRYNDVIDFAEFDEKSVNDIYVWKKQWLKKLIKRGNEVKDMVAEYLKEAPILNLTYMDLKDWVKRNCKPSSSVNFILAYSIEKLRYYIVGLTEDNKVFAAYCNTLNENLIDKFGQNFILTIKVK